MSKNIGKILIGLLIFIIIGVFAFIYYIRPQREYIKKNTQDCIEKAMSPIDSEVSKGSYSSHHNDGWFVTPLKEQETKLNNCVNYYNNILFSTPEKNLLILNINSKLNIQASKINVYKQEYANIVSQNKEKQAMIDNCNQLKAKYQKYNTCVSDALKNGQFSNNCEYPMDAMNDMISCAMMGISF